MPLVAPDVGGVQDRLGDLEQACGRVGMHAHPDRAPEFASGLRQEGGKQIGIVQLVRDAGEDQRTARRSETHDAQRLPFGRLAQIAAQMPDVLQQCAGQGGCILRPVKAAAQCLALGQAAEDPQHGCRRTFDQVEQVARVGQRLSGHVVPCSCS